MALMSAELRDLLWAAVAPHILPAATVYGVMRCATLTSGCILAPLQGDRGRNARNHGVGEPRHTDTGEWGNWARVTEGMSQHIIIRN